MVISSLGQAPQRSNTPQELLDNTINHFTSKNRSTKFYGHCSYRGKNGFMCAIGRELPDALAKELDRKRFSDVDSVFEDLPPHLQKMSLGFLKRIQWVHDGSSHFDEDGLTYSGKLIVEDICKHYELKANFK